VERRIIGRGLAAGALAGLFAFLYARVFIEPVIGRAIDYESGRGDADAALTGTHEHDMELFTRDVQSWAGMGFGVLAFSVAMGGLFALAFVMVYPRVRGLSARMTALLLAGAAFVTVYLVPFLKYPANPPSIGEADTIKERSGLYLLMILLSVALAVGSLWLGRRLAPKTGGWAAGLTAVGAYVVAVAVVMWVLPAINETPQALTDAAGRILYPGFPADDLYHFRLYALGTQVVIWATIGVVFGTTVSRLLEDQRRQPITA
jgi:hypothetical protein